MLSFITYTYFYIIRLLTLRHRRIRVGTLSSVIHLMSHSLGVSLLLCNVDLWTCNAL